MYYNMHNNVKHSITIYVILYISTNNHQQYDMDLSENDTVEVSKEHLTVLKSFSPLKSQSLHIGFYHFWRHRNDNLSVLCSNFGFGVTVAPCWITMKPQVNRFQYLICLPGVYQPWLFHQEASCWIFDNGWGWTKKMWHPNNLSK